MSEKERNIGQTLDSVIPNLPDDKKEYLLGFAEGVAAMANNKKEAS